MMQLSSLANACSGQLLGNDIALRGVTTDSRHDCTDLLFVALKGDNFDAHDFISQAQTKGATALMVERDVGSDLNTLLVEDSHLALGQIAAWWRAQFVVPVIGITGSVGKTTVKEMLAAIFAKLGDGLVTKGNLNNEIGVPLTLLRFSRQDQYAIIEMGMNHAGEIARLTKMARPTIALINNAAAAHLEELGTVAAVAEAKGEIFEALADDGVAIINADDRHAQLWLGLAAPRKTLTFGLDSSADVTAMCELYQGHSILHVSAGADQFSLRINVPGKHNVANALAAITVSHAAHVPIEKIVEGLGEYQPVSGRLNFQRVGQITLIDDTYNANPASMAAAVDVLAEHEQTTLIVGDMAELGNTTQIEHQRLGELAAARGITSVLACGAFSSDVMQGFGGSKDRSFANQEALIEFLKLNPVTAGTVLVKGSRSARMERVVEYLTAVNESQAQLNLAEGKH